MSDKEETKNSNSREAIYLKEKIKEYFNNISIYYQQITSDQGALQAVRQEILELKKNKGEKGFPEAKGKLQKMQELHYNSFLLDQSVNHLQVVIYEFYTMAKIFGIEIELPESEEAQEYFRLVTSTSPHIFAVRGGKAEMVNTKITNAAMQAMQGKMSEEKALKDMYLAMV